MEKVGLNQFLEFGAKLKNEEISYRAVQGFISYWKTFNFLGELAFNDRCGNALKRLTQDLYLQQFELNAVPEYFRPYVFGYLRAQVSLDIHSDNIRYYARKLPTPPTEELLDKFSFWHNDDLGIYGSEDSSVCYSYRPWIPAAIFKRHRQPIRRLIRSKLIELKGIDEQEFIGKDVTTEIKRQQPSFILFPVHLLQYTRIEYKGVMEEIMEEIMKPLADAGIKANVRMADIWEVIQLFFSIKHALVDRDSTFPHWDDVDAVFTPWDDSKKRRMMEIKFDHARKRVKISPTQAQHRYYWRMLPIIELTS